jgi:hypothetical protein
MAAVWPLQGEVIRLGVGISMRMRSVEIRQKMKRTCLALLSIGP